MLVIIVRLRAFIVLLIGILIQEWIDIDSQNYWDGEYKHFTGIIDNQDNYKKYRLAINRITVPYHNHDDVGSSSNLSRLHIGAINFYGLNDKVYNNIVTYTSPEREQLSNIIIDTNNKSKVYYFKIYSSNIERGYDAPSDFKLLGSDISNNSWTIIQEWNDIKAYEYKWVILYSLYRNIRTYLQHIDIGN